MKDKSRKDFGTSQEYQAYLSGYNDGIVWTRQLRDRVWGTTRKNIKDIGLSTENRRKKR